MLILYLISVFLEFFKYMAIIGGLGLHFMLSGTKYDWVSILGAFVVGLIWLLSYSVNKVVYRKRKTS